MLFQRYALAPGGVDVAAMDAVLLPFKNASNASKQGLVPPACNILVSCYALAQEVLKNHDVLFQVCVVQTLDDVRRQAESWTKEVRFLAVYYC